MRLKASLFLLLLVMGLTNAAKIWKQCSNTLQRRLEDDEDSEEEEEESSGSGSGRCVEKGKFKCAHFPYKPRGRPDEHDQNAHIRYKKVDGCFCEHKADNYAGYYNLPGTGQKLFFWFFLSRNEPEKSPALGWFNGGPGCSSVLGLYTENGPCLMDQKTNKVYWNPYSWNDRANAFFIDQPPGTGWSRGKSDSNSDQVGRQVSHLFHAMAKHQFFGKYFKNGLFLAGESYAGHYLPAMAHQIWSDGKKDPNSKLKLKGVACGNGMTDPHEQYAWFADMARNSGTTCSRVNSSTYRRMKALWPNCKVKSKRCSNTNNLDDCVAARSACSPILEIPLQTTFPHWNQYDFRIKCVPGNNLCYKVFDNVEELMNKKSTKKQLGTKGRWQPCSWSVNANFKSDWMRNFGGKHWSDLLESGIRIMLYAGDQDYICNWIGNKAYILKLKWSGKKGFNLALDKKWIANGVWAGNIRQFRDLTFLQVFDAGHMVPLDQPKNALTMINTFMDNSIKPPVNEPKGYKLMKGNEMCRKGYSLDLTFHVPLAINVEGSAQTQQSSSSQQLKQQQQTDDDYAPAQNQFEEELREEIESETSNTDNSGNWPDLTQSLANVFNVVQKPSEDKLYE